MNNLIDLNLFITQLKKRQEELLADYDELNVQLSEIDRQIQLAQVVRKNYQRHFRLPVTDEPFIDQELQREFGRLSIKDMLIVIAQDSDGLLDLAVARKILVRAGVFKDDRNAATSMAPILSRHEDIFRRVARGRYVLVGIHIERKQVSRVEVRQEQTAGNKRGAVFFAPSILPPQSGLPGAISIRFSVNRETEPCANMLSLFGCSDITRDRT